jgi:diguanylate cyclase (GGDEF)-like protein/PAS domain S-box-containing protein
MLYGALSSELAKKMFEEFKNALIILDSSGKIKAINSSALELFRLNENQALSSDFEDICTDKEVCKKIKKVLERDLDNFVGEISFKENGNIYYFQADCSKVKYDDNDNFVVICAIRDISKRKTIETKLKESEERFRELAKTAPFAIMMYQNDKWVYANTAATEITGYSEKDLLSMDACWDLVHPSYRQTVKERVKARQSGIKAVKSYELVITKKDGEDRWIYLSGDTTTWKGKYAGIITAIDITKRKQIEQKLKESEQQYKLLFENANDAIFVHDTGGNFLEANSQAIERLGYSKQEFLNMSPRDIDDPAYAKKVSDRIEELLKKGYTFFETVHVAKDGRKIPTELSSRVFEYKGKKAILSIARDITERKKAEEILRKSEEKLKTYFDLAQVITVVLDVKGNIKSINKKGCEIFQMNEEDLVGESWLTFIPEDYHNKIKEVFDSLANNSSTEYEHFENPIITSTGEKKIISWRNAILKDDNGNINGVLSSGIDVTQERIIKKETEKYKNVYQVILEMTTLALRTGWKEDYYDLLLKKIVSAIPEAEKGSCVIRKEGYFEFVAACGYDIDKLREVEFSTEEVMAYSREPNIAQLSEIRLPDGRADKLAEAGTKNLNTILVIPLYLEGKSIGVIFLDNFKKEEPFTNSDVELAKLLKRYMELLLWKAKTEEKLHYAATHDPLTGVMNRRAFLESGDKQLKLAKRYKRDLSILYIDFDGFKEVNDTYGHDIGDSLLVKICERIEKVIRESDIFARIGGDEFVILLPETDYKNAKKLVERLHESLDVPFVLDGNEIRMVMSIGISTFPDDSESINRLIKIADERMYKNKPFNKW